MSGADWFGYACPGALCPWPHLNSILVASPHISDGEYMIVSASCRVTLLASDAEICHLVSDELLQYVELV